MPFSKTVAGIWAIPLAVLLLAAALRVLGWDKGLWYDEYATLRRVQHDGVEFGKRLIHANTPPLYFIGLKVWVSVFGSSETFLRAFNFPFALATVIFLTAFLRPQGRREAWLAGLLGATLPPLLVFAHEIRGYALLTCCTAAAFAAAAALRFGPPRPGRRKALALALSGCVLSHAVGLVVVGSVAVYLLWPGERHVPLTWRTLGKGLLLPLIVGAAVVGGILYPHLASSWWMPPPSSALAGRVLGFLTGATALGAEGMTDVAAVTYQLQFGTPLARVALCLGIALVLGAGARLSDSRRWAPPLAAAVAYLGALFGYSALIKPIVFDRTVLPAVIPLVGFVVLYVTSLKVRSVGRAATALLVVLCGAYAFWWVDRGAYEPRDALPEVTRLLRERWRPGDFVFVSPAELKRYHVVRSHVKIEESHVVVVNDRLSASPAFRREMEKRLHHQAVFGSRVFLLTRNATLPRWLEGPPPGAWRAPEVLVRRRGIRLVQLTPAGGLGAARLREAHPGAKVAGR